MVTAWTEGAFSLARLLPLGGKEPAGADPKEAPRPQKAVRLLSARIEGAPHAVTVYGSSRSPDRVLADYETALLAHGWQRLPLPEAESRRVRAFTQPGLDMLVSLSPSGRGSSLCVVQSPSRSAVVSDRSLL